MRLRKLQRMDPVEFENYVGGLFRRLGYRVEGTRASGDEGVDLVLRRGRRTAVVQVKRYQGSVGQPVIRDLYGAMMHAGASEAYLVTTGSITRAARRWAADKPIHLIDGHRLIEWSRTNRLNYDKPSALTSNKRQLQYFIGLVALAVVAVYAVNPQRLVRLQENVQAVLSNLGQVAATATPTATVTSTITPMPVETPTGAPSLRLTPVQSPPPRATPVPTGGKLTPAPGGVRPGPTVFLTPAPDPSSQQ